MKRQEAEIFYKENVLCKIDIFNQSQISLAKSKIENIIRECVLSYPELGYQADLHKIFITIKIPFNNDGYLDEKDNYRMTSQSKNNFIFRFLLSNPSILLNTNVTLKIKNVLYSLGWDFEIKIDQYDYIIKIFYPSNYLWFKLKKFFFFLFWKAKINHV